MRKTPLIVSAALIAAATLLPVAQGVAADLSSPVAPPPPVTAPGQLALQTVNGLVVDSVHEHLFILGAANGSAELLVTDYAGTTIATIPLTYNADETLSGGYLYVGEANDIAVIDAASLQVVRRIPTFGTTCPDSLAVVANRYLAYAGACHWSPPSPLSAQVDVIDLSSPNSAPQGLTLTGPFFRPIVRAIPNSTRVLVGGLYTQTAAVLDVSGIPSIAVSPQAIAGCSDLEDLTVSADGTTAVAPCYTSQGFNAISTADLSVTNSYPGLIGPVVAAFTPQGNLFAVGSQISGIALYTDGGSNNVGVPINLGADDVAIERGLAFSPDGKTLFAITLNELAVTNEPYDLHVVSIRRSTEPHMVLSAPRSWVAGVPLGIAGYLTFSDGSQRDETLIAVTRSADGVTTTLPPLSTSLGNNMFYLKDTPTAAGRTTYTFVYGGDPLDRKKTQSVTVNVEKAHPALSIKTSVADGGVATVTATLVGGTTNHTVTITAKPKNGVPTLIATGTVDPLGQLAATYKMTAETTFTATYAGDGMYTATSAHVTSTKVSPTPPPTPLAGQTATIAIANKTPYHVSFTLLDSMFNHGFDLKPHAAVAPFDFAVSPSDYVWVSNMWLNVTSGNALPDGGDGPQILPGHSYLILILQNGTELFPQPDGTKPTLLIVEAIQTS